MGKLLLSAPVFSLVIVIAAVGDGTTPGLTAWIVPILVIAFLIFLNGLYVASEFAIIGTRPSQMEEMANEGDKTARAIWNILDSPQEQDRYIATAQLGITIASLGLGMYAEPAVAHLIEPYIERWFGVTSPETLHSISYVLVLSTLTYLHVVLGEMVPKSLALSSAAPTALRVSSLMRVSQLVLSPLVWLLNGIGAILLRILNLPPPQARVHSPEEIEQIVTESAEGGLINEEEEEIIRNIFDFGDRRVGQVMTPRRKVQAIPLNMARKDLVRFVAASSHNRFPVYKDNRDHIVGILHMQKLIEHELSGAQELEIRRLLNPAPAVPEDKPVEDLLATFKQRRIHMAIVLDEFGGMAGVVTLEDLVEEVVGEVRDEFDVEAEPLVKIKPGLLEVAGNYLVDDLIEHVDLGSPEELPAVDTVGGLVVTRLGRPPKVGDECTYGENTHFAVTDVDGRAVARVRVTYPIYAEDNAEVSPNHLEQ